MPDCPGTIPMHVSNGSAAMAVVEPLFIPDIFGGVEPIFLPRLPQSPEGIIADGEQPVANKKDRQWTENEHGPTCIHCGEDTVVKVTPSGKAILWCLVCGYWPLPRVKPENLPDDPEKWPEILFAEK